MKSIFKIAKNEFRYLFYSPIAWFLMIVFIAQCAYFYSTPLFMVANAQDVMLTNSPKFKGFPDSLTSAIFLQGEIFSSVMQNLYLFLPLLTMGLISREINNKTIELLYSSPVSLRKIVFGKYLGIMLYNLLLVGLSSIIMLSGFFSIQYADYGIFLSATLGFYLLICAYTAIGLFMSCLTSYQIVSALSTFTAIFVLSRIGGLWQRYDLVRDLTYFLSLQNRTGKMLNGLISTKDVIYFIMVTCMFIYFTLLKLKGNREDRPWYVKAGRYTAVMGTVLLIGYISSRPTVTGYWDVTATKKNTIHPRTRQQLKAMGDSTLEVTLYANLLGGGLGRGLPELRNVDYLANLWEPYLRFKPDIRFKYVYYYDYDSTIDNSSLYAQFPGKSIEQIAFEMADMIDIDTAMFKTPAEIRRTIDLLPEKLRLVMQLKYRGRTTFLRTYDDTFFWPDETNMNAALQYLIQSKIPNVAFVTGELERNIYKLGEREYAGHSAYKGGRGALINTGFSVDTLNLLTQEIPRDITTLVLADPKMDLPSIVSDKLKHYIDNGGNMFIAGEPGKQYVLNPFLEQLGIKLASGQLVQPTFDETPDKITASPTIAASQLSEGIAWLQKKEIEDTLQIIMPGATTITHDSTSTFQISSLATTISGWTWLRSGAVVIDSTLPAFDPVSGDRKEDVFPVIMKLTRQKNGKEQRIVVSGDADFASNIRIGPNAYFLMPAYSWLVYNQSPVYTPRPAPKDILLSIGPGAAAMQKTIFVWILPGLLLLAGTILLIRRKRK